LRARDAETGGAAVGAHRSDLLVSHGDHGMAADLCSTGEQKALLLRIVLAHARLMSLERGTTPLLLLDEVVAHLDDQRRSGLFDEILAMGLQVWLTGTDAQAFAPLGDAAQRYRLQNGLVRSDG
ncbi:MAG TPA: DNA replication and repair protein RecF, partial [Kiloniellales bacterium]|nr:DNA replication and repair protein RecF [Kiloniellales bacterium]